MSDDAIDYDHEYAVFTEADAQVLSLALRAGADEVDYSEFYIDDEDDAGPAS